MVRPTVHDPFFDKNSLYGAEVDSGRSGTTVTVSGDPPEFGLGFKTEHGIITGSHIITVTVKPSHYGKRGMQDTYDGKVVLHDYR